MDIKSIANLITEDINCNGGTPFSEDMAQKFRLIEAHSNDMNTKIEAEAIAIAFEEGRIEDATNLIDEGWRDWGKAALAAGALAAGGLGAHKAMSPATPSSEAGIESSLSPEYEKLRSSLGSEKFKKIMRALDKRAQKYIDAGIMEIESGSEAESQERGRLRDYVLGIMMKQTHDPSHDWPTPGVANVDEEKLVDTLLTALKANVRLKARIAK
jgi:hypothetical protein